MGAQESSFTDIGEDRNTDIYIVAAAGGKLTPANILKLRPARMRSLGLSTQKTAYIRDLARHTRDGLVVARGLRAGRDPGVAEAQPGREVAPARDVVGERPRRRAHEPQRHPRAHEPLRRLEDQNGTEMLGIRFSRD